ncbi:aldose 1-epimerase [Subsaxibacter sp. CAU 1640]|uniref:aldose 1-epimerase n=1 Tax=Subsaxibacter sp. CAU 1640 TaxID=2933271 RepID=UPI002004A403|nr:aldose 1-epimerase [Subsaxibacter sp. CAU 1640]MCK7589062.1 aldose 1-epimerase [Subsaxibacter sp. CAU 1640]
MFEVNHIQKESGNYVEVKHSTEKVYAKIDLNLGGSLQELILDGATVISSQETVAYEVSYASSILFPFVNRIENGQYHFNGKSYQLDINKVEENNALHGLVYNKPFDLVHSFGYKNDAVVHVRHIENGNNAGFPFKYILTASYIFKESSVEMIVDIKNMDNRAFPFTLGWHPYFVSSNLSESYLSLNCHRKILVNSQLIPTHEEEVEIFDNSKIKDLELDNCFLMDGEQLQFKTPDYHLNFTFSKTNNYVQIYIPPNRKTIAIEPQSGAANSFNDPRGLKLLQPNERFESYWKVDVKSNATA